jgi:putative exporter of polyketide antibiotics
MDELIFLTYILSMLSVLLSAAAFVVVFRLEEKIKKKELLEKTRRR